MISANPLSAPHAHASDSVPKIMLSVWVALLPASGLGVYQFGWPALNILVITSIAAVAAEAGSLWVAGKNIGRHLADGSALLTGWILGMSLPPWAPWWLGVFGAVFAIVVGKHVFGGLGQNLFNPAMLARVALLVSFPLEMTQWPSPAALSGGAAPGFLDGFSITFAGNYPDALTGATVLGHIKTELAAHGASVEASLTGHYTALSATVGTTAGSLGETSAALLLLGGLFLMFRRTIAWHIPAAMLGTVAVLATAFHLVDPSRYADAGVHLLSGGLIMAALFIATDPVGSPATPRGRLIFGMGCGALIYVIRVWGGYPEGVAFAVLLMNAVTPIIDHYVRPRIYGREAGGTPLEYQTPEERS